MLKCNVLIVSGYWPTEANSISGIFVVQQAEAFSKLGIDVTVLLTQPLGRSSANYLSTKALGLSETNVRIKIIKTLRLPEKFSSSHIAFKFNSSLLSFFYSREIKYLNKKHGPFSGGIIHGGRYAFSSLTKWRKFLKCKVVSVLHGVDPLLEKLSNMSTKNRVMFESAKSADSVVLVGTSLKTYAHKLGIPNEKLVVVSNGTNIPTVTPVSQANKNSLRARRVISVSNLVKLKGVDHNLRALSALQKRRADLDFEYIVIGDGPEKTNLLELARQLEVEPRVKFLGRLAYEQTMLEIEKADIFSLPSWGEAFGIVYLEAMARCKPVIGCLNNGAADIFENGKQGFLIEPHDVATLSKYLELLIENDELCESFGKEGRNRVDDFSWETNALTMLKLLNLSVDIDL